MRMNYIKPYVCELCGEKFRYKATLLNHCCPLKKHPIKNYNTKKRKMW